jgi:hypothetical protein
LHNFPQQKDEFVAPKGLVGENDAASQAPSDDGEMEADAQPLAEAPPLEIPDEEIAFETAASAEDAATVAEDAASREIEPGEMAEEPVSEAPVEEDVEVAEIQEAAPQEGLPDTSVTFGAAPEEETPSPDGREVDVDETAQPAESQGPREGEGDLLQVASITETLPTETVAIEDSAAPFVEEEPLAEAEPQPVEKSAPAEDLAEESIAPEVTSQNDWESAAAETSEKSSNYVIGVEVILGLFALGTGLAWLYIRRRGG